MKAIKMVTSLILTVILAFSSIVVMADSADTVASTNASFSENTEYSIWLKQDGGGSNGIYDPVKYLRGLKYRWNINGAGNTFNAVVHLDSSNGDNHEMKFKSVGSGYYGIKHADSGYWIDVEHDSSEVGNVLHQYHKDLDSDNQYFRFVSVANEPDTYYIISKKTDKKNNNLYVGTENDKTNEHTKIALTKKATKWVIKPANEVLTTGEEVQLLGSKNGLGDPHDNAPVFMLNPVGYIRDVNVNNTGTDIGVPNGNCLHLYYLGTSSKISAEWIESKKAYRLRSYYGWEDTLNQENPLFPQDLVWDVDGASVNEGAVIHVWSNQGNEHKSQLWRFIPHESIDSAYYIYNVNSSLYLSLEKESDEDNVKLVQSKTPLAWELKILNQNSLDSYTQNDINSKKQNINAGNWMSHLPDNMYLSEVNMPATHDAGAARMLLDVIAQASATLCHQLYLDEQLNAGVRAWDIRVDTASAINESDPNIVHGLSMAICRNRDGDVLELEEVMNTARDFLATHPKETIIMTMKGDGKVFGGDEDVADHLVNYILDESYPIYRPSWGNEYKVPLLGDVRGKIVFVRRLALSSEYQEYLSELSEGKNYSVLGAFGMDASKWDNNDYSTSKRALKIANANIYAQDNYKESDANKKLEYFKGAITDATNKKLTLNGQNFLFNYSAAKDNLSQPRAINMDLMTEDLLNRPTSVSEMKTIGIAMTNYIDAKLSERIYMTNFVADHTHEYDGNGFCKKCYQYQPAKKSGDTYQISNAGQMFWFAALVNGDRGYADFEKRDQSAKAVLMSDIDLGVKFGTNSDDNMNKKLDWIPIQDFKGEFDGQNHTISNARINANEANVGIFGSTSGKISNLTVKGNLTVPCNSERIGGVIGYANGATVSNVISYVNIENAAGEINHVGGVIGSIGTAQTIVDKCVNYGNITVINQNDCIGGVIGYTNGGGRITNCANIGTVKTTQKGSYTGGILGYMNNTNPTVQNCFNYGTVDNAGDTTYCGAIVGWLRNCGTDKITNNYYLTGSSVRAFGSAGKTGEAKIKTAAEFACGNIAYLLNNGVTDGTQAWYQDIDNGNTPDDYPGIIDHMNDRVYAIDAENGIYSNHQYIRSSSALQRFDLRTYHYSADGQNTVYGYGIVNNDTKSITVYVNAKTKRIGIYKWQGTDGKVGRFDFGDQFLVLDYTNAEIIADNIDVPDIYIDKNGCLFISVNGKEIKPFTVDYIQNSSGGNTYDKTTYTVNIVPVAFDFDDFQNTIVAPNLKPSDPDYDVMHGGEESGTPPGTGDSSNLTLWFALLLLSGAVIIGLCIHRRKELKKGL